MKELVKINAAEYGLDENKAKQISDMFKPMLDKMTALEVQFNEVVKRPIEPETIQMAHDLRLSYVKVRTGTADIHQKLKSFYLQGGRFVDGWKNAQRMASQGNEDKLRAIEDHFINIETERIIRLQEKRSTELQKYTEFVPAELGTIDDAVWTNYISGVKLNYESQKEAEAKAEKERLDKIEADRLEQERIRKENEQLKKEAEARERHEKIESERREKEEIERLAKEREEREAHEAAMKEEREAKEKIEAELKAKQDAELQAQKDEEARIQSELSKGDKAKVNDLVTDLNSIKSKYTFKSKKNQKMYSDVSTLIDKVIDHINQY